MQHFNIIGVDIAVRNSGFALYNTKTKKFPFFGVFRYKAKFEYEYNSVIDFKAILFDYISSSVLPAADMSLPFVFVVEGVAYGGHFQSSMKILSARTMMFNNIHYLDTQFPGFNLHKVYSPTVGEWKREILGKGNANKTDTYAWLLNERANYGVPLPLYGDVDTIDAACLAIYGVRELQKGKK